MHLSASSIDSSIAFINYNNPHCNALFFPPTCRTLMDLLIAVTHIVSWIGKLSEAECNATRDGCRVIGIINQFALLASSFWYVILAVDLIKAIRNPFR